MNRTDDPKKGGQREWRSFEAAREYVRGIGLKNQREWREWCRDGERPADIPSHPQKAYKDQWQGLGDWLGTGTAAPKDIEWRPFAEARQYVRSFGLKSFTEWNAWAKSEDRPADIPTNPSKTYAGQWRGWGDWLRVEAPRWTAPPSSC